MKNLVLASLAGLLLLPYTVPARPIALGGAPRPKFVDVVWKVKSSRAVRAGQLYVFLSEGSLAIAAKGDRPSFGKWTYKRGHLTMIEEGQPYKVDILRLTAHEFKIRMHAPRHALDITLVRAA